MRSNLLPRPRFGEFCSSSAFSTVGWAQAGPNPHLVPYLGPAFDALAERDPRLAAQFLELAGYDAVDLGADAEAQRHYLRAIDLATVAGDRLYGGYLIAVSLGHLVLHRGDPRHTLRLVSAAMRGTEGITTPAVLAAFHAVRARAHARLGDGRACAAALYALDVAFDQSGSNVEPEWIRYFGVADIADEKAHCFFDLGRDDAARREAAVAIGALGPSRVRRLAMDTALLASAHARAGDLDEACAAGRLAVDHAGRLMSFRSTQRVMLLMAHLQGAAAEPVVRELAGYVSAALPQAPMLRSSGSRAGS